MTRDKTLSERRARIQARHEQPRVGHTVVRCRGCGQERWYGFGLCPRCGEPGPANDRIKDLLGPREGEGHGTT